ncbi:hypothetical protein Naga_100016g34 [Nannochloropsis gaditana]|uniref:ERCC4 domain-containing protein n=1 Tax=Nannochloropsis gaditana TaxID=72520 RepID=W7TG96_9STRA|nr:hypothetical protein Naga_100016g34 [Nannochloropsis gaditana]
MADFCDLTEDLASPVKAHGQETVILKDDQDDEDNLLNDPFEAVGLPAPPIDVSTSSLTQTSDFIVRSCRMASREEEDERGERGNDKFQGGAEHTRGVSTSHERRILSTSLNGRSDEHISRVRKERRAAVKAEREAKQVEERIRKARAKLICDSQRGLYKHEEIVMVVEKRLRHTPLGEVIADIRRSEEFKSKQIFVAGPGCAEEEDEMPEAACYHPGLIMWARMPKPLWDSEEECPRHSGPFVEQLGLVIVVWDAGEFCDKLAVDARGICRRRTVGDSRIETVGTVVGSYDTLQHAIQSIRLSPGIPADSRVVLVLQGVKAEIASRWRQRGGGAVEQGARLTMDDYADALVWMLLAEGIEYKETKDAAETGTYLRDVTRALAEVPFRDTATELSSAAKGKAIVNTGLGGNRDEALVFASSTQGLSQADKVATAWARQLEVVPGMSDTKALHIVNNHHGTLRSLLDVYQDPKYSEEEKMNWLADKMESVSGTRVSALRCL